MGKVVGGTSKLNSVIYLRGHTRDYDSWAERGNVGWAYENVLPYFKKSENQRGKFKNNSELNDGWASINLKQLACNQPLQEFQSSYSVHLIARI
jgi:choline dehydrogenase-like flavoprotein